MLPCLVSQSQYCRTRLCDFDFPKLEKERRRASVLCANSVTLSKIALQRDTLCNRHCDVLTVVSSVPTSLHRHSHAPRERREMALARDEPKHPLPTQSHAAYIRLSASALACTMHLHGLRCWTATLDCSNTPSRGTVCVSCE